MHCHTHEGHTHEHGPDCGHVSVSHDGHTDYLHDGHMHHVHHDHVDDHAVAVTVQNPTECAPLPGEGTHRHQPGCGHETVPHGDHLDYLVEGRLHHLHIAGGPDDTAHCDDHGLLT
jgi:hypothetical protein